MSKITEIICDGCGKAAEWKHGGGRPRDWRRLHITGDGNRQWVYDICSPRCASRAMDSTYEDEDRQEIKSDLLRRLRVVP
jgi:hypothetical protein